MSPEMIQGSDEWLKLRKGKIGASESAAILGISPYMTARKLWEQKLDIIPTDPPTKAMMDGIEKEPRARADFILQTQKTIVPEVCFHPKYPWMMASLDGINHEEEFIVEIKCGGQKLHDQAKIGIIPEYYMCQIQHQLAVKGFKRAYYDSYYEWQSNIPLTFDEETGEPLTFEIHCDRVIIPVDRNDQFIEDTLIPSLKEFWDCLSNLIEPPLQDGDYEKMNSYEWNFVANDYRNITDQIKQLTEHQEKIKNKLISMSGNRNCIGGGIRVMKTKRKGAVDYGSIPELGAVNLEQYRKKGSEYWTIREV